MQQKAIGVVLGTLILLATGGVQAYAADPDMPGGEPRDFRIAILAVDTVSFMQPSAIIVDEKIRQRPLELVVSNNTNKEHGFSIDKFKIKEVVKPGESKTIKISVTDLDAVGTDQSAFRYYCQLHPGHIGGQLFVRR
jgi:nitrosocyanin